MVMDSLRAYTAFVEACCAPVAAGAGVQDHASLKRGPPLLLLEMVAARDEGISFSSSPELLVAKILGAQLLGRWYSHSMDVHSDIKDVCWPRHDAAILLLSLAKHFALHGCLGSGHLSHTVPLHPLVIIAT
jgi:hypothetical protein